MPAEMLLQYWGYVLAGIVLIAVAYWAYDERDPEERAADTTKKVGNRAARATGGLVGVLVAILLGLATTIMQTGMELGELAMPLLDFVGANPEVSSGIVVAVLGWMGISGSVPISGVQFFAIAIILIGGAVAIAAYTDDSTEV